MHWATNTAQQFERRTMHNYNTAGKQVGGITRMERAGIVEFLGGHSGEHGSGGYVTVCWAEVVDIAMAHGTQVLSLVKSSCVNDETAQLLWAYYCCWCDDNGSSTLCLNLA